MSRTQNERASQNVEGAAGRSVTNNDETISASSQNTANSYSQTGASRDVGVGTRRTNPDLVQARKKLIFCGIETKTKALLEAPKYNILKIQLKPNAKTRLRNSSFSQLPEVHQRVEHIRTPPEKIEKKKGVTVMPKPEGYVGHPDRASVSSAGWWEQKTNVEYEPGSRSIDQDFSDESKDYDQFTKEITKNESGRVTHFKKLDAIVVDESYLSRKIIPKLLQEHIDQLVIGKEFPPIKIEKSTHKLVDGLHRLTARRAVIKLAESGEVDRDSLSIKDLSVIKVEEVEIPKHMTPRLFSLTFNVSHGCPASEQDKISALLEQCKIKPGLSITELAKISGLTTKKVKKYAGDLIKKFEEEKKGLIKKWYQDGKTQTEISTGLREIWPHLKGVSQSVISDILSEKSHRSKTDKGGSRKSTAKSSTSIRTNESDGSDTKADPLDPSLEGSLLENGNNSPVVTSPSLADDFSGIQAAVEAGPAPKSEVTIEADRSGVDDEVIGDRSGITEKVADQKAGEVHDLEVITKTDQSAQSDPSAEEGTHLSDDAAKNVDYDESADNSEELQIVRMYHNLECSDSEHVIFERFLALPDPKEEILKKIEKILTEAEEMSSASPRIDG